MTARAVAVLAVVTGCAAVPRVPNGRTTTCAITSWHPTGVVAECAAAPPERCHPDHPNYSEDLSRGTCRDWHAVQASAANARSRNTANALVVVAVALGAVIWAVGTEP